MVVAVHLAFLALVILKVAFVLSEKALVNKIWAKGTVIFLGVVAWALYELSYRQHGTNQSGLWYVAAGVGFLTLSKVIVSQCVKSDRAKLQVSQGDRG